MAFRQILLPWDSYPQEAFELSQGEGPVRAPLAVVLPTAGDGGIVVSRHFAEPGVSRNGTGVAVRAGRAGLGFAATASTTNVFRLHSAANALHTVWERPSTRLTIFVHLLRYGAPAGNAPIFGNVSPNTSPFSAYNILENQSTGNAAIELSTAGSGYQFAQGTTLPTNTPFTLALVYNGANGLLYQNGVQTASVVGSGAISYPNAADRGPALGNFWDFTGASRSFVGEIYSAAIWDEALSVEEIRALHADPWDSLIAPRRIWVPQAGITGIPTLSLPTVTNITTTGAKPRVTITFA